MHRVAAEDYAGAKIVQVARGTVIFEKDGKTHRLSVALSLKVIDEQGQTQDAVTGTARYVLPGNIVDIKTAASKKGPPQIVEIRFVSGTVGELPRSGAVKLQIDPNFKGSIIDPGGHTTDLYWLNYIPQARVGDYVEYTLGSEPGRMETVEVGKDFVVVGKVSYILGTRQEQRVKHRLPPPGTDPNRPPLEGLPSPKKKKSSASKPKEELVVAGKKVVCEVESSGGKPSYWRSADVPFDGLVKNEVRNGKYRLTDFGRGPATSDLPLDSAQKKK